MVPRRARLVIGGIGWLAVSAVGIALVVRARSGSAEPEIPVLAPIAEFELTDQDGRPFGSAQLRERVWVAGFAFTSCRSVCPLLTAQMANLQRRIARHGDRVHLVTFTVDPETDTPQRLREYALRHHADLARWSFLTGDPEQVRATIQRGFMVAVGSRRDLEDGGYDILHTAQLLLVDRRHRLRGLYETTEEGLARLERDITRLLH
jgi:protein SCO1/2